MTSQASPKPYRGDGHPPLAPAEFHELLDAAATEVGEAVALGTLSRDDAAILRRHEATLRYQIRQLRSARDTAATDLESGLRLAWSRFQQQLRDAIRNDF